MQQFLRRCRVYFVYAGIFSVFVNVLMLTIPLYMLQIFDRVITSRSMETLVVLTIAAAWALMLLGALDFLRNRLMLGAGVALDQLAGVPVIKGLIETGVKPGSNKFVGGLRDVASVRGFLTGAGIFSLFDSPWVPVYVTVIFLFHPYLGFVAVFGAIVILVIGVVNEKVTRKPLEEMRRATGAASAYIDAGLRNAEVLNALGMTASLTDRWQKLNEKVIDAQAIAGRRGASLQALTKFTRLGVQVMAMGTGAWLAINQQVTMGVMVAATLLLARALSPVESAIVTWKGLVDARMAYANLNALLGEAKIVDPAVELPTPEGKLEVERVIYAVPNSDRPILRSVSFALKPGELLGLIGPSAAGKSTLARILTGVWRPVSGIVRLDGSDVSLWPREQLGPHLGYLPQDVELFNGTVAENIARLQAFENDDVLTAAKRAHVHDMIVRLPKGYETPINEGGVALSAGQRQRVGLARALFGNPRFVVLDEPNANLDGDGEAALVRTLQRLREDRVTTIIISHRPSLLAGVDKILVLREGQVEGFGPRNEIMQKLNAAASGASGAPQLVGQGGG